MAYALENALYQWREGERRIARAPEPAKADRGAGVGVGGGFSCRQSCRSDTATANATVPEEVPTHLDDLVVELTEADENWLLLNRIAWSALA